MNIKIVAEKAGVSIATVSRVFSGNNNVKENTRQKILSIANELNYRPSPIARGLSTKKTDTIGLILPELNDEFFMEVIHCVDEEAHNENKYLMVSSSHSQRNIVETLIEFMSSGRVDGVILMAPKIHGDMHEFLIKSKRPIVLINACKDINGVANISINNFQGTLVCTEHLIEHGYKRIGMIKGPRGNCEADERYLGFKAALKKHGIPLAKEFIIDGDFSIKSGYHAAQRLFSQKVRPEAIFAANDMMALGVYQAAKSSNLVIPRDIALAGFDDIFLSGLLQPRLTTVHVPIAELTGKAVRYLLKMIDGVVDIKKPHQEVISTGLVIGNSCGCVGINQNSSSHYQI